MTQDFAADLAEIALGRRTLLGGAAALGAASLLRPRPARAAPPPVVLCNWGGEAVPAFTDAFVKPYEAATGGQLVLDGSGPSNGKVRAMVEAGHTTWDLCDSGLAGTGELGPRGLLAPIDYTVVDKGKVLPEFAYEFGVCNYMFSTVMAWNRDAVSGTPTLADFFDLKRFPGKRMVRKDSQAMLEMALMADGVPAAKLYPLDVDRAMAKLGTIRDQLLFWTTGAQSQQMLREGEAAMGWLWHTRATLLGREPGSRVAWSFQGGLLQPGLWTVPRGNPAGRQAMVAIAQMQAVPGQVTLLRALANGPANPQAEAAVPADLRAVDPGTPANVAVQARIDGPWYQEHYAAALRRYVDTLAS